MSTTTPTPDCSEQIHWISEALASRRIATSDEVIYQCQWLVIIGYLFGCEPAKRQATMRYLREIEGSPDQISQYFNTLLFENGEQE